MKAHLIYLLHRLRESFWLLPCLIVAGSTVLAWVSVTFDRSEVIAGLHDALLPWLGGIGPEGARLILSTITGAMITTASLVFSLLLVALTLASGQLGPRLLSMFMRDRITQVVLGLFLATFVYGLFVLTSLSPNSTPLASVAVAVALTVTCLITLIVFVHHLAVSMQADVVVSRVADSLREQIDAIYPPDLPPDDDDTPATPPQETGAVVAAPCGGYVQVVDAPALVEIAARHDLCIRMLRRAGHFVCEGDPLAVIHGRLAEDGPVHAAIVEAVAFGAHRTPAQDPEFALMAMVEIGVRALSPGINDPHTAITCVDRLGEALALLSDRSLHLPGACDAHGTPRLFQDPVTFAGLTDVAFNELRQNAGMHVSVLLRLVDALERLARKARTAAQREAVHHHLRLLRRACKRHVEDGSDLEELTVRIDAVCGDPGDGLSDAGSRAGC